MHLMAQTSGTQRAIWIRQKNITADQGLAESASSVPLNRVCTPLEVAHLVMYAASNSAAFMSGCPLVLDAANRA